MRGNIIDIVAVDEPGDQDGTAHVRLHVGPGEGEGRFSLPFLQHSADLGDRLAGHHHPLFGNFPFDGHAVLGELEGIGGHHGQRLSLGLHQHAGEGGMGLVHRHRKGRMVDDPLTLLPIEGDGEGIVPVEGHLRVLLVLHALKLVHAPAAANGQGLAVQGEEGVPLGELSHDVREDSPLDDALAAFLHDGGQQALLLQRKIGASKEQAVLIGHQLDAFQHGHGRADGQGLGDGQDALFQNIGVYVESHFQYLAFQQSNTAVWFSQPFRS